MGAEPRYDEHLDRLRLEMVVFDTMIVRHICAGGGGSQLAAGFAGRIAWPEAVNAELTLQSRGIPELRAFLARKPATVLEVDPADEEEVEDIRIDMYTKRAARRSDTEHLGEAQCLFFAERDGYPLATNDGKARERARASWDERTSTPRVPGRKKVDVFHILQVLQVCIRTGACRPGVAWDIYSRAVAGGLFESPGFAVPGSRERFLSDSSPLAALRRAEAERLTGE